LKIHHIASATALAAGLIAAPAAQAQAQTQPSAPASAPAALPSSPAKKALAAKIADLQKPAIDGLARSIALDTVQRVGSAAGQAMAQVPADKREALGKEVQAELKAFHTEAEAKLRDSAAKTAPGALATLMDERFTEAELKQVLAWLQSPVSKKYQQLGGEMQAVLTRKLVEDTRGAVDARFRTLEQSLQKRFAPYLPSPASAPASAPR
jgi:uncharacterized protein